MVGHDHQSCTRQVLEVPELVDFFVGEVPNDVVRGYRLIFEKFGQAVVGIVETGLDVEFAFELE